MSKLFDTLKIDPSNLAGQSRDAKYPKPVEGRVANIDADFLAYQVACETRKELDGLAPRRDLETMKAQVRSLATHYQKLAGATSYVLFITPSGSNKGGRAAYAVSKEYQANRSGRSTPPEHLSAIRGYMGEELPSSVSLEQEADDALAQANYRAIAAGTPELSVLMSKDKDLWMVPGYYYDFAAEAVEYEESTFGWIGVDRSKSSPKVVGRGTKYFWAQCIMGDAADNICGLPKWGAVKAADILADASTDIECYDIVRELYQSSPHKWTNWKTGEPCSWGEALYGDMHLLWMRRTIDDRVDDFLKEVLATQEEELPWKE